jgi:hypothetical protein
MLSTSNSLTAIASTTEFKNAHLTMQDKLNSFIKKKTSLYIGQTKLKA